VPTHLSVFKDETKLDINYVPLKLPHREEELHLLMEFFNFALQSPEKMAQRVLITGNVGTGKTALSQRFGANITSEANKRGISLRHLYVNCRELRGSLFLILQHVVSTFHPNFPKRGYSAEEILTSLMQILDEQNTHVILILDEFESLIDREGSEAVYKLTRLQEARQNKPQRLSLLCVVRSLKSIGQLDTSTRSTLQSNVINLEKYSKQQLVDILNDRILLAFNPLAVPRDTVDLIGEIAVSESGGARFGIELLWRAGKYADAGNLNTVPPECVRKAVSSIVPEMRKSELINLGLHEKLFLLGIVRALKKDEKAYVTFTEAELSYAVVCEEFETIPRSHTQLWKYLRSFSALGIISSGHLTETSRGRATDISLPRIPIDDLEKELRTLLENQD
jgi:cell division control protein 6